MNGTASHFIVATAGHVDHGKSALVKALTGTDPDRLPEEKARGITIDLGFARLLLNQGVDSPRTLELGIVDVPGHEDLIKNMVAGVGSIDLALLVVAADDGWMPQTEEHLQILTYLGVTRGIAALTKVDLDPSHEGEAIEMVREQLRGTVFSDSPIIPISTVSGRGLAELKAALGAILSTAPPLRDIGKPRLAIDRAFSLRGVGTVVTGTLVGGCFRQGQSVVIQPDGMVTRIRSLQSHNTVVSLVGPGTRVALNLPEVVPADRASSGSVASGVHRGQVVTLTELGPTTKTLNALLTRSPRPMHHTLRTPRTLANGARVRLHYGTSSVPARVLFLDKKQLDPGDAAPAQLRLECAAFLFDGDRFILRDWSEQTTLAGGLVLEGQAGRKSLRHPAQQALLRCLAAAPNDPGEALHARLVRDHVVRRSSLLTQSQFSADQLTQALAQLEASNKAVVLDRIVAEPAFWEGLRGEAALAIDSHHQARPHESGLATTELRAHVAPRLPVPEAFEALIANLSQLGFVQSGTVLKRATHRQALPPGLEAEGEKLRKALSIKPLEPPSRKDLTPTLAAQQALKFLIQTGQVVELSPELVLLTESYAKAITLVRAHLRAVGKGTVSDLRQLLATSRRVIVPLLEKLDRDRITKREGDFRILPK